METVLVGRKKSKPDGPARKPAALIMRGSGEWRAWLEAAAAHSRMSVSAFMDFAAASYAKAQGFSEKPPRR